MTRVLPDPAPARTSCGPMPWVTAAICSGLSSASSSLATSFFTGGVCPREGGMASYTERDSEAPQETPAQVLLQLRRSAQDPSDGLHDQSAEVSLSKRTCNFDREVGIAA